MALIGFSMGGGEVARYVGRYGTQHVTKAVFAAAVPPYLYKSADNPDGGIDDAILTGFHDSIRADAPHGLNVPHAQTFNAEVLAFLRG